MFRRISWVVLIIAVSRHVTSVLSMMSSKFEKVTSPIGEELCSVDRPSSVLQMECVDTEQRCAMECLKDGCCLLYQFKKNSFLCEVFEYATNTFSVIPSCSSQRLTIRYGTPTPQCSENSGNAVNGASRTNSTAKNLFGPRLVGWNKRRPTSRHYKAMLYSYTYSEITLKSGIHWSQEGYGPTVQHGWECEKTKMVAAKPDIIQIDEMQMIMPDKSNEKRQSLSRPSTNIC